MKSKYIIFLQCVMMCVPVVGAENISSSEKKWKVLTLKKTKS